MKRLTPDTWARICRIIVIVMMFVFVVFSILTYYDRLSQYATGDQILTLERTDMFLKDPSQATLTNGSNLSNIIVGLPGQRLAAWLDGRFKSNEYVIGNLYYTSVLPYALVQVTIALLSLLGCVFLLGKLANWQVTKDYTYYLLAASIVLNFPMLKGLCKILKYDALSIILGAMALLLYFVAAKQKRTYYLVLAIVVSALAYIEKDTVISVIYFIALSEIILISLSAGSFLDVCLRLLKSLSLIACVFFLTVFVAVPKIWTNPGELLVIFSTMPGYGVPFGLILVSLSIPFLLFVLKRHGAFAGEKIKPYLSANLVFALLAAIVSFALFYQKNDMKWTFGTAAWRELKGQGFWVGKQMGTIALTTLDKSPLLTTTKYFLAECRLIIYFLPEALVLILLLSPFLIPKLKDGLDKQTVGLIAGFCLLSLVAYAYLLAPIEAKYLSLVMFALLLLLTALIVGAVKQLSETNIFAGSAAAVVIMASLIVPAVQNAPTYFGYMNIFRSRKAEDIRSIKVKDYTFWTWVGWGETSYALANFAGNNFPAKDITIGFDYLPPFHSPSNVTMMNIRETWGFNDMGEMSKYLKRLVASGVDYIIISKNTACRILILNQLVKQNRNKAIYVDRQGGIEYGWLFRPADLVSD